MTTLVRPDAPADGGGGEAPQRPHEPSRYAAWRSSWAVALRMARRDVRRHKGRSALIVVMVAVPTLLLSLVVTLSMTDDLDSVESIPFDAGHAARRSSRASTGATVVQGADPQRGSPAARASPRRRSPGYDPDERPFDNADAIARLVGAPVIPLARFTGRTTVGERRISVDGRRRRRPRGLGDRLRLLSGRWPQGDVRGARHRVREVPRAARQRPAHRDRRRHRPHATTSSASRPSTSRYGVRGHRRRRAAGEAQRGSGSWIVTGRPIRSPGGRAVGSTTTACGSPPRQVLLDPPSVDELPAEIRRRDLGGEAHQVNLVVGLGAAMLLIITALLVGPGLRGERHPPATHPRPRRQQRRQHPGAAAHRAGPGARPRWRLRPARHRARRPGHPGAHGPDPRRGRLRRRPARSTSGGGCSPASPCAPWGARWSPPSLRRAVSAGSTSSASCAGRASRRARACSCWRRASCSPCSAPSPCWGPPARAALPSVSRPARPADGGEYRGDDRRRRAHPRHPLPRAGHPRRGRPARRPPARPPCGWRRATSLATARAAPRRSRPCSPPSRA